MARSSTTFQKGDVGNPKGRKPFTPAVRKALKSLQKGSRRAAERLLQLCESEDGQVAVAACKAVLAKVLPDMKQVDQKSELAVTASGLSAEARRAAVDVLETLASRESGSQATTH